MRALPLLVALATLSATLVAARPAAACTCARPGVTVLPRSFHPAPLNTTVRVSWPRGQIRIEPSTVALQTSDKKPVSVATTRVSMSAGQTVVIVLTPKAPLDKKTKYQVVAAATPEGKVGVVGTFTTTEASDDAAPTWAAPFEAQYRASDPLLCGSGKPHGLVTMSKDGELAIDDLTPSEAIGFGVWSATEPFDAKQPPLTIVLSWGNRFVLGTNSACMADNFDIPIWPKAGDVEELKLRVAPIDLAGNVGEVRDVLLTNMPSAKPSSPAPAKPAPAKPAPAKPASAKPAPAPSKPAKPNAAPAAPTPP